MFADCTPAVARAQEAAERHAQRLGAGEVQPIHLLAGLLIEEEGQAACLLQRLGAPLPAVRLALDAAPAGPAAPSTEPALPLAFRVRQAFVRARELEAVTSGAPQVSSGALLLALLESEPELLDRLKPLGLDPQRLQRELQARQTPPVQVEEPLQLVEATERMDTARILDASANRAREALRVVEDYCRFVLDDAFLSCSLKQLRHDLAEAMAGLAPTLLLEARDTLQDVGTRLSTEREGTRHSLRDVVQANLKRLQEALRTLEEVGKLGGGSHGAVLEQLRYRSYTIERALLLGADARGRLAGARLYVLLTGAQCKAALDWTIREAAAGGASIFQLREKSLNDRDLLERARHVRRWTREVGALFIMNDRPDIARLAEADGVHVGQEELPVKEARRIAGPGSLVGVSTHSVAQVRQAVLDGASYIGVGPTFPSGTKHFAEFPGLDFVRQATAETSLPAFVIGGVTAENIGMAIAAGARRVAVSQAVGQADDPRAAAATLWRALTAQPQ